MVVWARSVIKHSRSLIRDGIGVSRRSRFPCLSAQCCSTIQAARSPRMWTTLGTRAGPNEQSHVGESDH